MKILFPLIVLILLASCNKEKLKNESINLPIKQIELPLQTIKNNSVERKSYLNLDALDLTKLTAIDSSFFKSYFLGLPIDNFKDYKIEFDPYSRYYFFDYKDVGNLTLFSIIHDDEVGYDNLFHFTYDREKNRLLYVDFIAATGSDGGAKDINKLKYNQPGDSLTLTRLSEFWSDFEKGSSIQYDSVVYRILFKKEGTKYTKLDSISRMDTVWTKN